MGKKRIGFLGSTRQRYDSPKCVVARDFSVSSSKSTHLRIVSTFTIPPCMAPLRLEMVYFEGSSVVLELIGVALAL